jgi:glutamate--cysteine ligase
MNQKKYSINSKEELETFITGHWNEINEYIDAEMEKVPVPLYSSVDIRESKDKFAPVDHNLYPAGFNNLCQLDLDFSTRIFKKAIDSISSEIKTIAIQPESHTKNLFYLDHLAFLQRTIEEAGYTVFIASLDDKIFQDSERIALLSHSKFDLVIHRLKLEDGELFIGDSKLDLLVLNNDQSDPIQVDWEKVKTPIAPTPRLGWFARQKTKHFGHYRDVIERFSERFSVKPCLMQALFRAGEDLDFSTKEGVENLAKEVDHLLKELPEEAQVFVKASQGTYGMGISVVSSGEDVLKMNRKTRNKMDVGKNKIKFTTVIIQEGIESILKYDEMAAEVAIYLVAGKPVGGFIRANSEKGAQANLNSKGMVFRRYCISEIRQNNDHQCKEAAYSIVARLATLASAYEVKETL